MRNIPENNLAYPVLITWNSGITGSGFNLGTETKNYLVTAKHCLFNNKGELHGDKLTLRCPSGDINDDSFALYEVTLSDVQKSGNLFAHPTHDVAAFEISTNINPTEESFHTKNSSGVKLLQQSISPIILVNANKAVALLKDVLIGNDVFIYGYPRSLGLKHSPQFEYDSPLLRKGIIANVNKKQGTIILDAPVYYGNSGGPVIQATKLKEGVSHKVIGVVSEFIPYSENWINQSNGIAHTEISNSGYSVAVSMNYVFEMLKLSV